MDKNNNFETILKMQNYPFNAEPQLKAIAGNAAKNGWHWSLIQAYQLGYILGKRFERLKRNKK